MRYLSLLLLLLVGCLSTPQRNDNANADVDDTTPRQFDLPFNSLSDITSREQLESCIAHYWDNLDFAAGKAIDEYNRDDIYAAFAQYVLIIPQSQADSLLRALIVRAEQSREVLDLFSEMARDVLYDPNAPTRNDEYYIPILETILESKHLDEYDKIIPQTELHTVLQNRRGHLANDFNFTLADGHQQTLYDLKADYTILLFNNPGCEMCREIIEGIESSTVIDALRKSHDIKILAIYPDEDINAWRDYLSAMPKGWICAYDKELRLTSERLYDLKAIPSLYLLDGDKRVIIKDGSSVKQLEKVLINIVRK